MQIQVPVLGKFEFGRPQLYAALMLLAVAMQTVIGASRSDAADLTSFTLRFYSQRSAAPDLQDQILLYRAELAAAKVSTVVGATSKQAQLLLRVPALLFSLWLGGALWWVSRRLYNNAGGYVALGLYCSSPAIFLASSRVNAEILAAWGLFGSIYTAIGVAHTLYAPPKRWRIRIVLLGLAFGFTAAAHLAAGVVALFLGALFMLYLAPERRLASISILVIACGIAAALVWALYGFGTNLRVLNFSLLRETKWTFWPLGYEAILGLIPIALALVAAVVIFLVWKRTRYFGNWSALLVFIVLAARVPLWGPAVLIWALPFAFVFVGGIWADLLERGYGHIPILLLILAQEGLSLWTMTQTAL